MGSTLGLHEKFGTYLATKERFRGVDKNQSVSY